MEAAAGVDFLGGEDMEEAGGFCCAAETNIFICCSCSKPHRSLTAERMRVCAQSEQQYMKSDMQRQGFATTRDQGIM